MVQYYRNECEDKRQAGQRRRESGALQSCQFYWKVTAGYKGDVSTRGEEEKGVYLASFCFPSIIG